MSKFDKISVTHPDGSVTKLRGILAIDGPFASVRENYGRCVIFPSHSVQRIIIDKVWEGEDEPAGREVKS